MELFISSKKMAYFQKNFRLYIMGVKNMNNVSIIGQLEGEPELVYNSKQGDKKLYKLVVKVPKKGKQATEQKVDDFINVKAWSNVLGNELDFYDQAIIGIEGKITSFETQNHEYYVNEVVASRIIPLN
jgi:single-strand DNA-binding protein